MKPLVTKDSDGRYWCTIPDEKYPDGDDATVEDWFAYMSCGVGGSPIRAYEDWVADWENNKLFYEYDLEWMEELSHRVSLSLKEKM